MLNLRLSFLFLSALVYFCSCSHKAHDLSQSAAMSFNKRNAAAEFEFMRFRNPKTNQIPDDIHAREMAFAKQLPKAVYKTESMDWVHRGPNNFGGRTRALAYDVSDENVFLCGGVTAGIFKSTDGGANFSSCTDPQEIHSVNCLAQDTRSGHTNTWYYGTGESYGVVSGASFSNLFSGNGIYKSTDGGSSWNVLPATQSNSPHTRQQKRDFDFVWEIVVDNQRHDSDVVLAAVYNGIWRSADGGNSWNVCLGLDTSIAGESEYVDLMQTPSGIFYAAFSAGTPQRGIWRSEDGLNWLPVSPPDMSAVVSRIEMCYAPSQESILYVVAYQPGSATVEHKLWKGIDDGSSLSWEDRSAHIPNKQCIVWDDHDFGSFSSQTAFDLCIAVKPDDPNTVFLGGTNIYRSFDGFSTDAYEKIGGYVCDSLDPYNYVWPNHHPDQHEIIFHPSHPERMLSANDGGLFITNNCTASAIEWNSLNNGYNSTQFYTCAIEPGAVSNNFIIGGLQDNGSWCTNTYDEAVPWKNINKGDGSYAAVTHGQTNIYSSWQEGKVLKVRTDADHNMLEFSRIDPLMASAQLFINPFLLDPLNENRMYYAGGRFLWRNDDLNAIPYTNDVDVSVNMGWTKLVNTSLGFGFSAPSISCLAMCETDSSRIYYGTTNGALLRLDQPNQDTSHPMSLSSPLFPIGAYLASISVNRYNKDELLICFSNYESRSIFHSLDGGLNWTHVSGNLEEEEDGSGSGPSVCWVHIYSDADTTFYLSGTSIGLYTSGNLSDSSTLWQQEGPGSIGNVVVNMICSRAEDGYICVATHGSGMYSYRIRPALQSLEYNSDWLTGLQAYPQPFEEQCSLHFDLHETGMVQLQIFDAQGRIVWQQEMAATAGSNTFYWGSKELSSGIYLLRLSAQDKTAELKLWKR